MHRVVQIVSAQLVTVGPESCFDPFKFVFSVHAVGWLHVAGWGRPVLRGRAAVHGHHLFLDVTAGDASL